MLLLLQVLGHQLVDGGSFLGGSRIGPGGVQRGFNYIYNILFLYSLFLYLFYFFKKDLCDAPLLDKAGRVFMILLFSCFCAWNISGKNKVSICCVENGLEKRRKWEFMQEAVAEAQVRDAGDLDQGWQGGGEKWAELGEVWVKELTRRGDWLVWRLGEGGTKSPVLWLEQVGIVCLWQWGNPGGGACWRQDRVKFWTSQALTNQLSEV